SASINECQLYQLLWEVGEYGCRMSLTLIGEHPLHELLRPDLYSPMSPIASSNTEDGDKFPLPALDVPQSAEYLIRKALQTIVMIEGREPLDLQSTKIMIMGNQV